MPAPYIGHLSPEMQELSERLMRLQVSKAEREFEEEGEAKRTTARAPSAGALQPFAPVGRTEAEMLKTQFERAKAEREAAAAERTASVAEREQDLAERKQDWEMVKFQIEERGKMQREQMKAMAPMKLAKGEVAYLPGLREFDISPLQLRDTYTEPDMANVLVIDNITKEVVGEIPKAFRVKAKVMEGSFGSYHVFDENTGDYLGKKLSGFEPMEYALALDKATSSVDVALITERMNKSTARIRAQSAADVAGIKAKTDIDVATMEAESRMEDRLSDEKIARMGINATWKIELLRKAIEDAKLVLVEGRLELDRDILDSLNLDKAQERELKKFLALHHDDLLKDLGILDCLPKQLYLPCCINAHHCYLMRR